MEVGRGEEVRKRWRDGERGRKREKENERLFIFKRDDEHHYFNDEISVI